MTQNIPNACPVPKAIQDQFDIDNTRLFEALERLQNARTVVGRGIGKLRVAWRSQLVEEDLEKIEAAEHGILLDPPNTMMHGNLGV